MRLLAEVVNHFRLTWRLFWDKRVRWWRRVVFVLPLVYFLVPFRYDAFVDLMPLIGLLDDWLFAILCTYVFVAICPRPVVNEHKTSILLCDPDPEVRERVMGDKAALEVLSAVERLEMYRKPQEPPALMLGLAILVGMSALGGVLVGVLLTLLVGVSLVITRVTQAQTLSRAFRVSPDSFPQVQACLDRCFTRLPHVPVRVFVLPSPYLTAFSVGLDLPYALVLTSRLVDELDADELTAVVGHELGHILFEHTFFSSFLGGMLYNRGVAGLVWRVVFARWQRFAELTADRVALLACGEMNVVVRMLVRLAWGLTREPIDVPAILRYAYSHSSPQAGADSAEFMQTHPSLARRILALVDFDSELLASDVEKWLTAE